MIFPVCRAPTATANDAATEYDVPADTTAANDDCPKARVHSTAENADWGCKASISSGNFYLEYFMKIT